MKTRELLGILSSLAVIALPLVALWGWVANIVKLADIVGTGQTGMMIVRGFGIVVAPLGAVMGFF